MADVIVPKMVKEQVVRGVAVLVFIIALVAALTGYKVLIYFLILDFFTRAFFSPKCSLLALISRVSLAKTLGFRKRMITLKPKRFAAGIGLFMSIAAAVLGIFSITLGMQIVLGILCLFALLEGFLKFCAGCKMFALLVRMGILKDDVCLDCVYPGGDGI